MTQDGVESPVGPVLGGPRRSRQRFQIAVVGVIAIAVVAAGVGLAGNGPVPAPIRSPSATGTSVESGSRGSGPVVSGLPTSARPSPSRSAEPGCADVRGDLQPAIRLAAAAGDTTPRLGLPFELPSPSATLGPTNGRPKRVNGLGWPVPPDNGAVRLTSSTLVILDSDRGGCLRRVVADYAPANPTLSGPFPIQFRALEVAPDVPRLTLGALPAGDWVIRVVVTFATAGPGSDGGGVAASYFRAIVDGGDGPLPTPENGPQVPCPAVPIGTPAPNVRLWIDGGTPLAGAVASSDPAPTVDVGSDRALELRVDGDACAHAWAIEVVNSRGVQQGLDALDNPTHDPFRFAQNRWPLMYLPFGSGLLHAHVEFSADVSVDRWWRYTFPLPAFPAARAIGPDGTSVAVSAAACGSWHYPSGMSGYVPCDETTPAPALGTRLLAPARSLVRMDVPGWEVVSWNGQCGRLADPATGQDPLRVVDGCNLGGSGVPGQPVFLTRAGADVYLVYLTVQREGVTANISALVPISMP